MRRVAVATGAALACGALACEPRTPDGRARDTIAGAATPSGAARIARAADVPRPGRPAAALHVLRAPAAARNALEPLPESLAVELYDTRGRPASGAAVLWRVVAGGGSVSPGRSTTDSAGRAAASWTPGPSGEPQTVVVDVPGAGSVELHTTVPAASVAIAPRAPSLWPGDTTPLRVTLFDGAGHALTGGSVRWESADDTIARVTPAGSLVGVGAGATRVTAFVAGGVASGATTVTVLPMVAGRVVTLDGRAAAHVPVTLDAGAIVDTLVTDATGRFARRLPTAPSDTVTIVVGAVAGSRPARLHVGDPRQLATLGVVLLPETWTVTSGTARGERVDVDAVAAMGRAVDGTRFWRLERVRPRSTWAPVGWPADALPVPVTFPRNRGEGVTADDSAAFWRGARSLERELGMSLFTPATSTPDDDEGGRPVIAVVVDPSIHSAGYTFAEWNGDGMIGSAEVRVASRALLADETVVVHELMHALGFGHTSSWPSLMSNAPGRAPRLTASDVAYAQLLFRVREVGRTLSAPYAVVESAAAEREGGRTGAPPRRDAPALPMAPHR
ncbi:MAG TPA: Ig-like domain-containing protein [Gemmatimonadaceae bacterium]|nr:Ig-like domain-containing protein [Gemmatimonadaceae bacterium]